MKDVSPSQKTFSLHGIPEHLLAGVDPCLTSIWIWYGGLHPAWLIMMKPEMNGCQFLLPPFCGQGEGLVWGGLLVWSRHHVCRVHLGGAVYNYVSPIEWQ